MLYKVGPRAVLHPTWVWLVIVAVLFGAESAVMLILPALVPAEPSPILGALIDAFVIVAIVAPLIWWTLVRPFQEAIRLRTQFLGDLFAAIEEERRQTAHELHDGIGQELSLLISGLRSAHASETPAEQSERCRELQSLTQKALAEVRRISLGLRPSLLDDLGLVAAIEKVVGDFREHGDVDATFRAVHCEGAEIPDAVATALFRIAQEAMSNVVRHSRAKRVEVDLCRDDHAIRLTIADDGKGFDPLATLTKTTAGHHFGVQGMRERSALLGGEFQLESAPGEGCRIAVTVPLKV